MAITVHVGLLLFCVHIVTCLDFNKNIILQITATNEVSFSLLMRSLVHEMGLKSFSVIKNGPQTSRMTENGTKLAYNLRRKRIVISKGGPCFKTSRAETDIVSLAKIRAYFNDRYINEGLIPAIVFEEKQNSGSCHATQKFEKRHILAGTNDLVPFTYQEERDNKTIWKGTEIDIFKTIAESLNLTYEFVKAPGTNFDINSPSPNLAQLLRNKDVDIAVYALVYSADRTRLFDIIWPDYFGSWSLLLPPPTVKYDLLSNIRPFQASVWFAIVSTVVIMSFIMWIWSKRFILQDELSLAFLYNISLVVGQGGFDTKNLHGRFLLSGWNLGAVIIVFAYTSVMISFITAPFADFPIKKLEDFVTKGDLKPVSTTKIFVTNNILRATSGYEKKLGDIFRQCPTCLLSSEAKATEMVLGGEYGFLTVIPFHFPYRKLSGDMMVKMVMLSDFLATGKCRLAMKIPEDTSPSNVGWYIRKDLKVLNGAFKAKIMQVFEGGIIKFIHSKNSRETPCVLTSNLLPKYEESPLTINQLQTAFALLGMGWFLAVVIFVCERLLARYKKT